MKIRRSLVVLCLSACCAGLALAQSSNYYVTDGTAGAGMTHVWQGGVEVFNYHWAANGEMPIVVADFGSGVRIRQAVGQPLSGGAEQGDEYLPNGTPTGFHNTWNSGDPANITGYDAGFDGSSIFMVDWGGNTNGGVYRYNNNYGGRTFMFMAHPGDLGITYDSGTNTIWTGGYSSGLVQQWSLSGTPMASFSASGANALAYDSSNGSLWMSDGSNLLNYDLNGNLLGLVNSNMYVLGGEMMAVPEPATLAILGLGILAVARRRRKV